MDKNNIQLRIIKEVLSQILPVAVIIASIATAILIFLPNIPTSRTIPSLIAMPVLLIVLFFLKKGSVYEASLLYISIGYIVIFLGMCLNGGVRTPIFAFMLVLNAVVMIFYSLRITIIVSLTTTILGAIFVYLDKIGIIVESNSPTAFLQWLLYTFYQILLLHVVYTAMKMLTNALKDSSQKEMKIEKNHNYTNSIINSIGDALITIRKDNTIKTINSVTLDLLGSDTADNCLGKNIADVITLFEENEEEFNLLENITQNESYFNHLIIKTDSNDFSDISLSLYPLMIGGAESLGTVLIIKNITKDLKLREQLIQSQKMEVIGQLSSGVAHDFNNMLGCIIGIADLMHDSVSGEENFEYLEMILTSAQRAAELTAQLLVFGRKGKLISTPIDMHNIINDSVSLLKNTLDKTITIKVNLAAKKSTVIGDSGQLQNGIMNIAINASHAMPDGGEISFITDITYLDEEYCKNSSMNIKPGNFIKISINDTGEGIPQSVLTKIFEPFFTTKKDGKGTGLGLAAVYGMLESHFGAVTVYSELGVGTSFHIYLPLSDQSNLPEKKRTGDLLTGNGERILFVDDEETMRFLVLKFLKKLNYNVALAENGVEAVELYKKSTFDLVILDMIMPEQNGRKTFEQLKKINSNVKIILSSGFSKDKDVKEMSKNGLSGFLRKPFEFADLANILSKTLNVREKNH